jgi:hypothetical protein
MIYALQASSCASVRNLGSDLFMTHLVLFDTVKSMMAELFPHQSVTTTTLIEDGHRK